MKQMKFLMTAFVAVVMSVSVSSCMNGDDNTQFTNIPFLGQVKNTDYFTTLTIKTADGYNIKAKSVAAAYATKLTTLNVGDYVFLIADYDSSVDIKEAEKEFNVVVQGFEVISNTEVFGIDKADDLPDTQYASNRSVVSLPENGIGQYDNNNLILSIGYYAAENTDSHTFSLVWYTDESELKDKTDLTLYLRHQSTEDKTKETYGVNSYRVFNISDALNDFRAKNENKNPNNINIVIELNSSTDLPSSTTTRTYKYNYK